MTAALWDWIHPLVDALGVAELLVGVLGAVAIVVFYHQEHQARRRRPWIPHARPSRPVPPWSYSKAELELWLEARTAAERAAEHPFEGPDWEITYD